MFYTLFANCKNYGIDPIEWLTDVLTKINEYPFNKLEELLPANWKKV
ncbi:transposase domain-containing protein [Flammeovirga aprica]|uniref:Transposase domain-containing protein n=1 Tax=Flammeovirga aprica JL-4 TaxID=694437 RepID=A0A7X9XDH2_9BACT|nr:transposase domain-containing protein [Flammeovirga aprica JL-4]